MTRWLAVLSPGLALLCVLGPTGTARADCGPPPPVCEALRTSDAVFYGEVLGVSHQTWASSGEGQVPSHVNVTFRVLQGFKGTTGDRVLGQFTQDDEGEEFVVGAKVVVYTRLREGRWSTSCSRMMLHPPPEEEVAALAACPVSTAVVPIVEVVQQLRELPSLLGAPVPSSGGMNLLQVRSGALLDELRDRGPEAVPALVDGLRSDNVRLRQNAALALSILGSDWLMRTPVDIRAAVPALIAALDDPEPGVRVFSAYALAASRAESAVPALVRLLARSDVPSRLAACRGLGVIGAAARDALPALEKAASDPDPDVRRHARAAIDRIAALLDPVLDRPQ